MALALNRSCKRVLVDGFFLLWLQPNRQLSFFGVKRERSKESGVSERNSGERKREGKRDQ